MKWIKKRKLFNNVSSITLLVLMLVGVVHFQSDLYAASIQGTVTATNLNVRDKATTTGNVITTIPNGTKVTITDTVRDTSGNSWYKVSVTINSKTISGYASTTYIKKEDNTSTGTSISTPTTSTTSILKRTGYVNTSSLNVRKSASTTAVKVAGLARGTVVTVTGQVTSGGYTWYKISSVVNKQTITGYVVSQYVILHSTTTTDSIYALSTVNTANTPLYLTANTYDRVRARLANKQRVIRRGTLTVNGVKWTKVTAIVNKKGMNGYVKTSTLTNVVSTASANTKYAAKTTKAVKVKKIATTMAMNIASLPDDYPLKVQNEITVLGVKWYRVTFELSGTTYVGYLEVSQVEILSDAEFEEELAQFPNSYKDSLRKLHEKYPKWHFSAIQTGLDWNDVMEGESKVGRNVTQSNVPNGGYVSTWSAPFSYLSTQPGAYDWATDKYTLCDGTNWFTVNQQVISYFMDPRNFLTEEQIFQFESLAYDKRQKRNVVSSILAGTYMQGNFSVKDKTTGSTVTGSYADTFMTAGKESGASPYFLAARSKQETGVNGSGSVSGTYGNYAGYYNYYNIGGNDSSTGGAITNSLRWASTGTTYLRPWTTPYKSIVGGATYIASSYINRGQNTNYLQKFNVAYAPYYNHQYMTNVKAPNSEARITYNAYKEMDILADDFVFYIPVYKNMPTKVCTLPESSGNPNSYLKSMTVKNGSKTLPLTPTFSYNTTNYTMVVDKSVSSITVSGNAVSDYASVTPAKTYSLPEGKTTTIQIRGTAQNGTSTFYTLRVSRLA